MSAVLVAAFSVGLAVSCRTFADGSVSPQVSGGGPAAGAEAGGRSDAGGQGASGSANAQAGAGAGGAEGGGPELAGQGGAAAGAGGEAGDALSVTNGLLLWLRADQGITLDKGNVVAWKDQSPNHLDAIEIHPAPPPTFEPIALAGAPGVHFDGAGQHLALPQLEGDFKQGASVFALLQRDDALDACEAVLSASNGVEMDDITLAVRMNAVHYEVADQFIDDANYALPSHSPKIVRVLQPAGGATYVTIDGQAAGQAQMLRPATIARKDFFVGHSLYTDCGDFNGTIGELLLYDRELDSTEVDAVDAYLRKRWGKQ